MGRNRQIAEREAYRVILTGFRLLVTCSYKLIAILAKSWISPWCQDKLTSGKPTLHEWSFESRERVSSLFCSSSGDRDAETRNNLGRLASAALPEAYSSSLSKLE